MEQERQRFQPRNKQLVEDHDLLTIQVDPAPQHLALSAPTTPPRVSAALNGDTTHLTTPTFGFDHVALSQAVGKANKRKSVTYAPSVAQSSSSSSSPFSSSLHPHSFARPAGAKSMPASRRTSASSQELDELSGLTLQALSIHERRASPHSGSNSSITMNHLSDEPAAFSETSFESPYNAGLMLDDELDKEIQSMLFLLLLLPQLHSQKSRRYEISPSLF
jgi:hypothetical protein